MGARYLEAYAERLHAEICKDCWFQDMVIDLSEDEDEGDAEVAAEPASLGAKSGRPIDLTDSPPYAQRTPVALDHAVLSSSSTPQMQSRSGARMSIDQPRGHIGGTHDPQAGDLRSKTPGPSQLEAGARMVAEPMYKASVEQLRAQLSEWFLQHFAADATAQTDLSDLFRIYNGDYVCWPKLGSTEFLPILMRTFPGLRSKNLGDRTTVIEGVRPESLYAKSGVRSVHSRTALVQQVEKPDAFSQWLRTYYENAPEVETPGTALEETYRLHCNATKGTSQFLLSEFLEDLRKVFPTAQIILSTRMIRNIRLKPVGVSAVQTPRMAVPSSISAPAGTHASTVPAAAQASTQSSGQQQSHTERVQNAVSQALREASEWLREQYVVDQTCESKRMDIYSAYLTAFGSDKTRVNFKTLMEQVTSIFSTPSASCPPCDSLVFKGLKPKQPRPYNAKRCTPPRARHIPWASNASSGNDRGSTGATASPQTSAGAQTSRAPAAAQESTERSDRQPPRYGTTQDESGKPSQQVTNWLWDNYVVNPAAEVKQKDFYRAYSRRFDYLEPRDFDMLMKHVEITFSTPWVCCSTCNTMVFKGLKPLGSPPSESRCCTPPPSQQVSSSSRTTAANSRISASQAVPSRTESGPSTVGRHNREPPNSKLLTQNCRKWLSKYYIADSRAPAIVSSNIWQAYHDHCAAREPPQPLMSQGDFDGLLLQAHSKVSMTRTVTGTNMVNGIRPRYPLEEPERTSAWLSTHFIADDDAAVSKDEIWEHYKSDFDLPKSATTPLKFAEFLRRVKKDFPQVQTQYDDRTYKVCKLKGLRRKRPEEASAAQPVRQTVRQVVRPPPPRPQAGPSTVSREDLKLAAQTYLDTMNARGRKWLLKHYITDPNGSAFRGTLWINCRIHCTRAETSKIFISDDDFLQLVLRTFPGVKIQRGRDSLSDEIIGIRARWPAQEPDRTLAWLKTNFVIDMQATTEVSEAWEQYLSDTAIDPPKAKARSICLRVFGTRLRKTFPQAQAQYDVRTGKLDSFRGLRRKTEEMG
ncbi:unnamed protein product [Cercospora beticola]|nr:unnamed protein product [Cercospora beticola]